MTQVPNAPEAVKENRDAKESREAREGIPEGLWLRCPECGDMLFRKVVEEALHVCPGCQHHFRVSARTRIAQLVDQGSFEEMFADVEPTDPLKFADKKAYKDRLKDEQRRPATPTRSSAARGSSRAGRS